MMLKFTSNIPVLDTSGMTTIKVEQHSIMNSVIKVRPEVTFEDSKEQITILEASVSTDMRTWLPVSSSWEALPMLQDNIYVKVADTRLREQDISVRFNVLDLETGATYKSQPLTIYSNNTYKEYLKRLTTDRETTSEEVTDSITEAQVFRPVIEKDGTNSGGSILILVILSLFLALFLIRGVKSGKISLWSKIKEVPWQDGYRQS